MGPVLSDVQFCSMCRPVRLLTLHYILNSLNVTSREEVLSKLLPQE